MNPFFTIYMQTGNIIYTFVASLYPELKFWGSIGGILWMAFKGLNWLKQIKTNDLFHIHQGVEKLSRDLEAQTAAMVAMQEKNSNSIISELKELRADFRTFMNLFLVPPKVSPRRRK